MFRVGQVVKFYDVDSGTDRFGKIEEISPKSTTVEFYDKKSHKKRIVWTEENPLTRILAGDRILSFDGNVHIIDKVEEMEHTTTILHKREKDGSAKYQTGGLIFIERYRPL